MNKELLKKIIDNFAKEYMKKKKKKEDKEDKEDKENSKIAPPVGITGKY